jgi:hypothetical protein
MSLSENRATFTFNHTGQVDEYGASVGNYATVQENFDSRAEENLADINNIKTTLISETVDDSGAHNVKSAGIAGLLSGAAASIYAILSALKSYIDTIAANFQLGTLLDGSVTDVKLSDTAGQIKETVTTHLAETTTTETQPHGLSKNKLDATTEPTVTDDSGDGYDISSVWVDITSDKAYVCVDATEGAAVWKEITPISTTWEKIGEVTLDAPAAQVDFASIPSGYKEFKLMISAISSTTTSNGMNMRFNDDTGANYYRERIDAINTTASAGITVAGTSIGFTEGLPASNLHFTFIDVLISNLASNKTKRVFANMAKFLGLAGANMYLQLNGGLWNNTTAEINKISLVAGADNIGVGSRFVLWGVK